MLVPFYYYGINLKIILWTTYKGQKWKWKVFYWKSDITITDSPKDISNHQSDFCTYQQAFSSTHHKHSSNCQRLKEGMSQLITQMLEKD